MSEELRREARRRSAEQETVRRRQEQFGRDVVKVAGMPEGRRLLRWLVDRGGIFADDFQPGPLGAYRAGQRAAALALWRTMEAVLPRPVFTAVVLSAGEDEKNAVQDDGDGFAEQ